MKKICYVFSINLLLFNAIYGIGAQQVPIPKLIKDIKPSIVGVLARDINQAGTGVFLSINKKTYILTNEHVVALKDSAGKTIKYSEDIVVTFNLKIKRAFFFQAEIEKIDENSDLAALQFYRPVDMPDSLFDAVFVPSNIWKEPGDIKEGETVIYSGYPTGWGLSYQRNYPLSRIGIVSQVIPGKEDFLIDAFVQPGYSGSPVFLVRENEKDTLSKWMWYFIGIARSYPKIYKNVTDSIKIIENPGFANVIGTGLIKEFFKVEKQ
ncbi:MAG: serine protease [bacterium]|nr:serine protease [bacterium]